MSERPTPDYGKETSGKALGCGLARWSCALPLLALMITSGAALAQQLPPGGTTSLAIQELELIVTFLLFDPTTPGVLLPAGLRFVPAREIKMPEVQKHLKQHPEHAGWAFSIVEIIKDKTFLLDGKAPARPENGGFAVWFAPVDPSRLANEIPKDKFDGIVATVGSDEAALLLGLWIPDREYVDYMRARGYPADYGMATLLKDTKGAFQGEIKLDNLDIKASATPHGETTEDPDVGGNVFFEPGENVNNAVVIAVGKARHRDCTGEWSKTGSHPLSRGVFVGPTYHTIEGPIKGSAYRLRARSGEDMEVVVVPKIWDEKELATWATPVAGLGVRPGHFSEEEYYAAPIVNLRTYPVYHPKFEQPGYREWIKSQGPQRLIEPEKLKTKADWIEAGRVVFEGLSSPGFSTSDPAVLAFLSDADAIEAHDDIVTKDGQVFSYRWVVDQSGELKVTSAACAGCHFLVLPDKSLVYGPGPGNPPKEDKPASPVMAALLAAPGALRIPGDESGASFSSTDKAVVPRHSEGEVFYSYFGVPWVAGDQHARFKTMSDEDVVAWFSNNETDIGGTEARLNGSPFYTTRIADLRGVRHRRYLDATATHANRGPEDIARYGILVEYADNFVFGPHKLDFPEQMKVSKRAPDEALYAMGLYLYSLEPLPSPHPFDEMAKRGQRVFEAEGCGECHTPPIYTNNKLVAVPGFEPPADAAKYGLDVSNRRVGTDPGLALKTRKGTGYYKIPSLRGLWYRGLYEHSGSVSSLEDWFDPKRLRDDFVPTGWKGPGVKTRAVPGHKFGHDLSDEDKKALIAFLKTL